MCSLNKYSRGLLRIVFMLMIFSFCSGSVVAQTVEEPTASASVNWNNAQSAKVDNLAISSVNQMEPSEIDPRLPGILSDINAKEKELAEAVAQNNTAEIERLRGELENLRNTVDAIISSAIDTEAGVIKDMREQGMGWGEIALALGIHPGALGLGKRITSKYSYKATSGDHVRSKKVNGARIRSLKGDIPPGHGLLADGTPISSKGLGAQKNKVGKGGPPDDVGSKGKGKSGEKGKGKGSGKEKSNNKGGKKK